MKAAQHISPNRFALSFPLLLTMTAIVCLAAIQSMGYNASLAIATACSLLVFCARRAVPSTWEVLMNAYVLRSTRFSR